MDVKDLNKSQLILLAILLSFVTSIATGITTVTLMQQAPASITLPINRIVRETVEKIVPVERTVNVQALTAEEKKLLEDLKTIRPLTVTLIMRGEKDEKILATGLFVGDNKVVVASSISEPKEGETYIVRSIIGEQKVAKVTKEKDFTLVELAPSGATPVPEESPETPAPTE